MATASGVQYQSSSRCILLGEVTDNIESDVLSMDDYKVISRAISLDKNRSSYVKFMVSEANQQQESEYYILVSRKKKSRFSSQFCYEYKLFRRLERRVTAPKEVPKKTEFKSYSTMAEMPEGESATSFNYPTTIADSNSRASCAVNIGCPILNTNYAMSPSSLFPPMGKIPQLVTDKGAAVHDQESLSTIEESQCLSVPQGDQDDETETIWDSMDWDTSSEDVEPHSMTETKPPEEHGEQRLIKSKETLQEQFEKQQLAETESDWHSQYVEASSIEDTPTKHHQLIDAFFKQANLVYELNQLADNGSTSSVSGIINRNQHAKRYLTYADANGFTPVKRAMVRNHPATFIFIFSTMLAENAAKQFNKPKVCDKNIELTQELLLFACKNRLLHIIPLINHNFPVSEIENYNFWLQLLSHNLFFNDFPQIFEQLIEFNKNYFLNHGEKILNDMITNDIGINIVVKLAKTLVQNNCSQQLSLKVLRNIIEYNRSDLFPALSKEGIKFDFGSTPNSCRIHFIIDTYPLNLIGQVLPDSFDLNQIDGQGNTLLHIAFLKQDYDSIIWLLNKHVNCQITNCAGLIPLEFPKKDRSDYASIFSKLVADWDTQEMGAVKADDEEQFLILIERQTSLMAIDCKNELSTQNKYRRLCDSACKDQFLADLNGKLPANINKTLHYIYENKLYYLAFLLFEANPELKKSDCLLTNEFKQQVEIIKNCVFYSKQHSHEDFTKLTVTLKSDKYKAILLDPSLPSDLKGVIRKAELHLREHYNGVE